MSRFCLSARPGVEKITPYQPGKPVAEVEREMGVSHAVKLASNENPLGPSRKVTQALRRGFSEIAIYPDSSCFSLRQALAKFLGVAPGRLILGNGSNELLVLLARCFVQDRDEILTSRLSFVVYTLAAHMMNAKLVQAPLADFTYDLEAMATAITSRTRLIYIANPNNPTGTAVAPARLLAFIRQVPKDCLVVLDEAYYEYMEKAWQPDSLAWAGRYPNLVVLRTFSKAYALAGLRVGYGVVDPELARIVDKVRDPFNVNALAQVAARAALSDQAHVRQSVRLAQSERRRVRLELARMGLPTVPSQANFIFVNAGTGLNPASEKSGQRLSGQLMRLGVIVRPFPGPYVRITLGTQAQNDKMLRALKKVMAATL